MISLIKSMFLVKIVTKVTRRTYVRTAPAEHTGYTPKTDPKLGGNWAPEP